LSAAAAVRELSLSPMDIKFASCSDDHFVKIWDFNTKHAEQTLNLGNDVKAVDWHPCKGLLATGDKNSIISLWDPREGAKLRTIYEHKGEVTCLQWNQNGNWLLSGARDCQMKLWDVRALAGPLKTLAGQV
jgi:polyadenylation factor subunit 2